MDFSQFWELAFYADLQNKTNTKKRKIICHKFLPLLDDSDGCAGVDCPDVQDCPTQPYVPLGECCPICPYQVPCTVLYCTVLFCTLPTRYLELYCTVLYSPYQVPFTVLYCTLPTRYLVLYCTVLYCTVPTRNLLLYCTLPTRYLVIYCTVLYCTLLSLLGTFYCTVLSLQGTLYSTLF